MRSVWKVLLGAMLSIGFYAAGVGLSVVFDNIAPAGRRGSARDLIYLPSPEQARLMSLGFRSVVADYYWVQALQYFTDPTQSMNQYKNLADYLEVVIGVDPDYRYAYKFAAIAVPHDIGRFRFVNTRRSTRFLERAVERFPDSWEFHFFLGYNYLNFHDEPVKAAEQFAAASKLPGAPTYLAAFAARVWTVGGELDRAYDFARATLESSNDPEIIKIMNQRLRDLDVERELRRLEAAAKAFQEKNGRLPADLAELVKSGVAAPPPGYRLDPLGNAYAPEGKKRMVIHQDKSAPKVVGD